MRLLPRALLLLACAVLAGCRKPAAVHAESDAGARDAAIGADARAPTVDAGGPATQTGCAPELDVVAPVAPARLLPSQRTWAGDGAAARPVVAERRRARTADRWWKPGAPAIVLRTADGARCDVFVHSEDLAGPFFGFPGSGAAWKAEVHLGTAEFGHLVVVVLDDGGDVRALYEHEHNVAMDAGGKALRIPLGASDGLLAVTSSSGGDGETDAFLELLGLSASGEPQRLLELHGTGPMPHAVAEVTVKDASAKPELEGITSKGKGPDCFTRECLVCSKGRYAWNAKSATFTRVGGVASTKCP
jgi:hypothetical protein